MISTSSITGNSSVSTTYPTDKAKKETENSTKNNNGGPSAIVNLSGTAVNKASEDVASPHYGDLGNGVHFGTPDEFFAMQKSHYQELGYDVTDDWMAYFENKIKSLGTDNLYGGVIEAPPLKTLLDSV